jgi:hypothetical protein
MTVAWPTTVLAQATADGKPAPSTSGPKERNIVSVGGAEKTPTSEPGIMEVVATGVSNDPDKAIQAAFSQAIEQVVGVLVEADTIVKNDQIVQDQLLTYSKGFVHKNLHFTSGHQRKDDI